MFGLMLFLHLTGLFMWLGGLLAIVVMLSVLKKQIGTGETSALAGRIIRVFSLFAHPGAALVLVSGVYMIIQMGMGADKPLWLNIMEKGGGMIILLGVILTGIMGSRVKKRLKAEPAGRTGLSGYLTVMSACMALIVSVILVVSLKI